ncbi:MAG TPA: PKD domain-containing protein [Gemmatimonadales bacterium]|nr:PKD domain-containing protein [Gemmatimonadales bacterium]
MRALVWLVVAAVGAGLVTACKDTHKPEDRENLAPTANFSFQCPALRCDFEDTSTDDGEIVSWNWNFGTAGSAQRSAFHIYEAAGSYPVSLTVTDNDGATSTTTKMVNPKAPVVSSLSCVDGSAPGGFVECTLKLEEEAGFKVVLNSSSCQAHGNIFRTTAPIGATLTDDGCYEQIGKQLVFAGPFAAGTEIAAEMVAPLLTNPPRLRVDGSYPVWTLTYEDGYDADFNDLTFTLTALPTGN